MHAFKDDTGREWELTITVAGLKRVREKHKVDLMQIEQHEQLGTDPLMATDIVYTLLEATAKDRQVDAQAFGERLGGSAAGLALGAFWEELTDFFQCMQRGLPNPLPPATSEAGSSSTVSQESSESIPAHSP